MPLSALYAVLMFPFDPASALRSTPRIKRFPTEWPNHLDERLTTRSGLEGQRTQLLRRGPRTLATIDAHSKSISVMPEEVSPWIEPSLQDDIRALENTGSRA